MAGSKNHKGAAAKAAEAKRAKEAAAAAAAESDDDEEWVLDTTTPVVLDASIAKIPVAKKAVSIVVPPLPELPSTIRDKRGVVDETDEKRRERYDKEKSIIDRARRVAEGKALTGAKIAAGPYGERIKKQSHWEYVLCEMRWMARDFCAERDWKTECASRVGKFAASYDGKPENAKANADAMSAEEAELLRRKRRCAAVATEVARFWAKAWARASTKPIPPAATLVPPPRDVDDATNKSLDGLETKADATTDKTAGDAEKEPSAAKPLGAGSSEPGVPEPETGRPTRGAAARSREEAEKATEEKASTTPPKAEKMELDVPDEKRPPLTSADASGKDDVALTTPATAPRAPYRSFPATPPPPPGMTAVDQWAVAKLLGDVARLKRDVIREAMREKEEEEDGRDGKKGKKGPAKRLTAAEKKKAEKEAEKKEKEAKKKGAARGRGRGRGAARDEEEEDEDEDEDDDDDEKEDDAATGAAAQTEAANDETREGDNAGGPTDADAMPPPPASYLPGGVPDSVLDAELDLDSVAPMTPPRFSETDPEALFGVPVTYACAATASSEFRKKVAQFEAAKFAAYETTLRDWEEREKRRQRALNEAARRAEENEHIAAVEHRRRRALGALAEARRFEHAAAARAAAEAKAKALGKRVRGAAGDSDSSDDDEDGVTLAALAGGKGGKKKKDSSALDGKKKKSHHKRARLLGQAKPWTAVEDALLCAIVHEFGSNWGLITDVFAASAPFKGTYRRAEQCRWRFQQLTRSAEEGGDPAAAAALNLDKGTARQTISRALPVEDNTARVHFDRAAQAQARHAKARRMAAAERAGDDASRRLSPHASWGAHRGLRGLDPVEIADQALLEAARAAQAHAQQRRAQMGPGPGPGPGAKTKWR